MAKEQYQKTAAGNEATGLFEKNIAGVDVEPRIRKFMAVFRNSLDRALGRVGTPTGQHLTTTNLL